MQRILVALLFAVAAIACQAPIAAPTALAHEQVHLSPSSLTSATLGQASPSWTTPAVEATRPFNELLPSWNIDVPQGAAFTVELSVRDSIGWSPWLFIGSWGPVPNQDLRTTCDRGRVDIDIFRSDSFHTAARLRIKAHGLDPAASLQLHALSICFTDSTQLGPVCPLTNPPTQAPLEVPLFSQRLQPEAIASRVCSPTSVAMLLAYRGVAQPVPALAAEIYDVSHDIYGNWNRAVQAAWIHDVPGYLTRLNSWDEVRAHTDAGQPLIISIRAEPGQLGGAPYQETSGHLLTILGFPTSTQVAVADPAAPTLETVPRTYSLSDLTTVWLARSGVAYVLQGPSAQVPRQAP